MSAIRLLALVTAAMSYLLIVLGGVVRITGSGMGCGDHWPMCNGKWFPPLDDPATVIEWGHRLVASGVSALVIALAVVTFMQRSKEGVGGRHGPLRPALLSVGLLVALVLLGAVTVKLELPPASVVLHLSVAMAMLATLIVVALRAGPKIASTRETDQKMWRSSVAALALAGIAVLLGALTANLGAAAACMGFPLCSGSLLPDASIGGLSHIHWTHRIVAYLLTIHLLGMAVRVHKRIGPGPIRTAVFACLACTILQVMVAAGMMWSLLQPHWRATHMAAGTAVWAALVVLTWIAKPAKNIGVAG